MKVSATGMNSMTAAQAFRVLTERLPGCGPQVGVLPMDWPKFFRHYDLDRSTQPRYEHLVTTGGSDDGDPSRPTPVPRHEAIATRLRARVAAVLGMPVEALDETTALMEYLDSLLAVEISSWIEREMGSRVTIMELMNGPSIAQLAEQLTAGSTAGSTVGPETSGGPR
jgi:aryl carrier-like protein